jgi:hypothetical protein
MKYVLLICFGVLPYLLVFAGAQMSGFYSFWLDAGWVLVIVGSSGLAQAKAAKAKAREAALRKKIRDEITGDRLLHSLN